MDHIDRLIENSKLIKICEFVKGASPIKETELRVAIDSERESFRYKLLADCCDFEKDPTSKYVNQKLGHTRPIVYIIEGIGKNTPHARFKDYRKFWNYKQQFKDTDWSRPKLNSPYRLNSPSRFIMYVGSSFSSKMITRIKWHIGDCTQGRTSALYLKYWYTGECRITIRQYDILEGVLQGYPGVDTLNQTWMEKYGFDMSGDVLQLIEDDLADELNPAFGKRGGNNKRAKLEKPVKPKK